MSSTSCTICGSVRWSPGTPCPSCGAPPEDVLPRPLTRFAWSPESRPPPQSIEARFRVETTRTVKHGGEAHLRRRPSRFVGVIVAVGVAAVLLWSLDPALRAAILGPGPQAKSPQLLVEGGITETLSGSGPWIETFNVTQAGMLQGSYRAAAGEVWIMVESCPTSGCGRDYSGAKDVLYLGGVTQGGELEVNLTAAGSYAVTLQAHGGDGTGRPITVTWVTPLEVIY
jgi:hypothetical protein